MWFHGLYSYRQWAYFITLFPNNVFLLLLQYRPKVSYHLSSRFSRDGSRFSRDVSRFSRDISRFSRESLKHLAWHILRVRNQLPVCVRIVALQFNGKSMGPSNGIYMYALIVRSIHIKQTSNVRSDKY